MLNMFIFPEKNATESFWGKQPEVKGELQIRNADIYKKYKEGVSTKFFLKCIIYFSKVYRKLFLK